MSVVGYNAVNITPFAWNGARYYSHLIISSLECTDTLINISQVYSDGNCQDPTNSI